MNNEPLFLILSVVILVLVLGFFMISFMLFHQRRRERYIIEKKEMQVQFDTELIKTQIEVQEEVSQKLSSELHDNICQILTLAKFTLATIHLNDINTAQEKLTEATGLVTKSIVELRQLSKILHGEKMVRQGLIDAITQEVNWLQRTDYYKVSFTHSIEDISKDNPDKDLFLYRLLQESISNIVKHSQANTIDIDLSYVNNILNLAVSDNGIGFDVTEMMENGNGLGLLNMKRRTNLLGGNVVIQSKPGSGTHICFSVPYP